MTETIIGYIPAAYAHSLFIRSLSVLFRHVHVACMHLKSSHDSRTLSKSKPERLTEKSDSPIDKVRKPLKILQKKDIRIYVPLLLTRLPSLSSVKHV